MTTLQSLKPSSVHEEGTQTNSFLFIAADYKPRPGGVAAYIDTLARGLISLGDTVKVLAVVRPHEEDVARFLASYEPWVIPFQLEYKKPMSWLSRNFVSLLEILLILSPNCKRFLKRVSYFAAPTASIARMERILSKEKPTTIVLGDLDFRLYLIVLTLLEKRWPYGVIAHGCEVGRPPRYKVNDLVIRSMMLKGASWIAANSRHTKSLLEEWRIPSEKLKLVHPPICEEAIRKSAVLEPASRKDDDLSLVTICRLVKGKGIDLVMHALKILGATGIPYRYVIGGDGPERGFLESLVDELGLRDKVHFKGSVDGEQKWSLLRQANVFVMPSRFDPAIPWHESFGIALVEAAAFGVPAVASMSGGIPDAVVDGETGILVPEESPVDLADALTFLYQKPEIRMKMGRAARERARKEFSPTVIAARFREAIGEISKAVGQCSRTDGPSLSSLVDS